MGTPAPVGPVWDVSWYGVYSVGRDSVAEKIGVSAEPEVMAVDVSPHTHPFFVIASDGVFEFLSSQDVVDMVWFFFPAPPQLSPQPKCCRCNMLLWYTACGMLAVS